MEAHYKLTGGGGGGGMYTPHVMKYKTHTTNGLGLLGNGFFIIIISSEHPMRNQYRNGYIINQSFIGASAAVFLIQSTAFENDGRRLSTTVDGMYFRRLSLRHWFGVFLPVIFILLSASNISAESFVASFGASNLNNLVTLTVGWLKSAWQPATYRTKKVIMINLSVHLRQLLKLGLFIH